MLLHHPTCRIVKAVEEVELLHEKLINRFGRTHGLRDPQLFEGAVVLLSKCLLLRPARSVRGAAAYAFHIAQAQAFLDGNKRTGAASALVFLEINGVSVPAGTDRLYQAMIAIAEKRMDKEHLSALLRELASKTFMPTGAVRAGR